MSYNNNTTTATKRSRLSSSHSTQNKHRRTSASAILIDHETELNSETIKEQLNDTDDIMTEPIIEVPTKRLLQLKEVGGNLFVSSTTNIYSKTLQKLFDRVLFTKSLNNDVSTTRDESYVFERVLNRVDDNDDYYQFGGATAKSSSQSSINILILGNSSSEHAIVWKLKQKSRQKGSSHRDYRIWCSPGNVGTDMEGGKNVDLSNQDCHGLVQFIEEKEIDLVICVSKQFYVQDLDEYLLNGNNENICCDYFGLTKTTMKFEQEQLFAKEFCAKHSIPTLKWKHLLNEQDAQNYIKQNSDHPNWIIRATHSNGKILCKTNDDAFNTVKSVFDDNLFGKLNRSIIVEHGYPEDDSTLHVCLVFMFCDGEGDYYQFPIVECDPHRMGTYGPCPFINKKQLKYIRKHLIEKTLRKSSGTGIKNLFGLKLLVNGSQDENIKVLEYVSCLQEPECEVLLSLFDGTVNEFYDMIKQCSQGCLDLSAIKPYDQRPKKHSVNITITSLFTSGTLSNNLLLASNDKRYKLFHNQTQLVPNTNDDGDEHQHKYSITSSGERILNIMGQGQTLADAKQACLDGCEHVKVQQKMDNIYVKQDIAHQALEWYKNHVEDHHFGGTLVNGVKKKTANATSTHVDEDSHDEAEPMEEDEQFQMEYHFNCDFDANDATDPASSLTMQKIEPIEIEQSLLGEKYFEISKSKLNDSKCAEAILISAATNINMKAMLFNLNTDEIGETLGFDLVGQCCNDLLTKGCEPLYFQSNSIFGGILPTSSQKFVQQFYSGIEQACKQANCKHVQSPIPLNSVSPLSQLTLSGSCVGCCQRNELLPNDSFQIGDSIIGLLSPSASQINLNGYTTLKQIFVKKNIQFDELYPEGTHGETYYSLLSQKPKLYSQMILPLIREGKIKACANVKDLGLYGTLIQLLKESSLDLSAEVDASSWPVHSFYDWIYQHGGFGPEEMFHHFNVGIGLILIVDKAKHLEILKLLHDSFQIGTIKALPPISKSQKSTQQHRSRVHIKNYSFQKLTKSIQSFHPKTLIPQSKMKQEKKRVAVLISANDTTLLPLIDYSLTNVTCSYEICLVISTVYGLADVLKANEQYKIITKVVQPKKYVQRHFDMDKIIDDELQMNHIDYVCFDRYEANLSQTFLQFWKGRLLNIHPSLLPAFRNGNPYKDVLSNGVKITGCTVHFVELDVDCEPIIIQECLYVNSSETEETLEDRLHQIERELYPRALNLITSQAIIYQGKNKPCKWLTQENITTGNFV